ncbi:MAG TPA: HAMP domain-containing sensor histidine kinase, partial [Nitrososphaeraceae archaeon]|nr:HAMP domain-containing sensor histidine kinase [Nitrososphaeraceae archaeon]
NGKLKFVFYKHHYNNHGIVIEADKARITQVLSNLLNNAIKFTEEGTVYVNAINKIKANDQEVIVSVRDTGDGIDSEIMPRLFTKFATKSDKGTGLGLFICKNIIEAHGGRMWAENNADAIIEKETRGATFYFSLPLMNESSSSSAVANQHRQQNQSDYNQWRRV